MQYTPLIILKQVTALLEEFMRQISLVSFDIYIPLVFQKKYSIEHKSLSSQI